MKEKENRISEISLKPERLPIGYLDQVIEQTDYVSQKAKLLYEKKSLQEKICNLSHKQNDWHRTDAGMDKRRTIIGQNCF